MLVAASRLITQTGVNRGQLTAIGTVVTLPMTLAGLAVRRYLVRVVTRRRREYEIRKHRGWLIHEHKCGLARTGRCRG